MFVDLTIFILILIVFLLRFFKLYLNKAVKYVCRPHDIILICSSFLPKNIVSALFLLGILITIIESISTLIIFNNLFISSLYKGLVNSP